jgi:hypothetical protein
MENSAVHSPFGARPEIPPAIGYSLGGLLLWQLRRPILTLAVGLVRLALALVKPALLVLGLSKALQLAAATQKAPAPYAGDDESLLIPTRSIAPPPSTMAGLDV